MRHLAKLPALALAGLVATACGGTANALQGKSPVQVVRLASDSLTSSSYRMQLNGTLSADSSGLSGLPPAEVQQLAQMFKGAQLNGTGEVRDSNDMRFTMTVKPLTDKTITAVIYKGVAYVSEDGGKTYAKVADITDVLKGLPMTPADLKEVLGDSAQVTDLGATTRNGNDVEHLRTVLGPDYLDKLLAKLGGAQGSHLQGLASFIKQVMTLQSGTIDSYVRRSDGRLDSMDARISIAIDMGKLMTTLENAFNGGAAGLGKGRATPPALSGTLALKIDSSARMYDYGASITIPQPTVDPSAPTLPAGGLFGL